MDLLYTWTNQKTMDMKRVLFTLLIVGICVLESTAQSQGYYRQPDVHNGRIVFSAEGDIWTVSAAGGIAQRLTTHAGEESWPFFSPNGSHIAFRGSYEGGGDVYVISVAGGVPQRITWDNGGRSAPVGWSPDGKVLVRSTNGAELPDFRLSTVDPMTSEQKDFSLSQAAEGSISGDGTLYFARMPRQSSNSRFYKGGTAQKLWKFKSGDAEATPLTVDYPGTSRQPNVMDDGQVYFLTDRKGAMNVWSMSGVGTDLKQHTNLTDWDIQELASDGKTLVYRLGADIWTLNPSSGGPVKLEISLVSDQGQSLVEWETDPFGQISDGALSHDGKSVALISRGELFIAPTSKGRLVHASRDSGVRYRNVVFTSDSTHTFGLSDKSGELEWWKVPSSGIGAPTQVSRGPAMLRNGATPSPDGKYLVHTDYDDRLWLVDLAAKTTKKIAEASVGNDAAWSPDSRYIVYSQSESSMLTALNAYDTQTGKSTPITSDRFNDNGPMFSADGVWLFFTSSRTWNSSAGSPWGERAPQPYFENTDKIYAIPLKKGLILPTSDANELNLTSKPTGEIRWDLASSIQELPIPAGSYSLIGVNADRLFYLADRALMALDLKSGSKPVQVAEGVSRVMISGNGKKILLQKGGKIHVINASSGKDATLNDENAVDLSGWKFAVNKRAEWNQIYYDMWRLHRDYFWDPNMGGVNWEAMRDKYAVLLPRVDSREALSDLQGMLASELSILHSNAGGGDVRTGENRVTVGSLGGEFVRDPKTKGFKLVKVYQSDPDLPSERSPLAHPEAQMEVGSVILTVNGLATADARHIGELLIDQAGKQVRLTVQNPTGEMRDISIVPISGGQEFELKNHAWEYTRRMEADRLSGGDIGYVHLRAMGQEDIGQWTREFYSQTHKQGMIVDMRHNGGGNIDSWVLSQLMRKPWAFFKGRSGNVYPNMQFSFGGHLVMLVDERSGSDGEAVADGFRRLGLGKVIGVRTWGGEIWLSGGNRQVDGGVTRASETGVYGFDGKWLIEGWGFVPDIEVDNLPVATYNGRDAQLEAAVAHLKDLIAKDPRTKPEPPPYPVLVPGYGFPTPWKN